MSEGDAGPRGADPGDGRWPDGGLPDGVLPDGAPPGEELTPEELDEAIGFLRVYVAANPDDIDARAELADALCDRYVAWGEPDTDGGPDPAGLAAARADWREAVGLVGGLIAELDPGNPGDWRWPSWAQRFADLLGIGYSLDEMSDPADQDLLISWGTWLLGRIPDPAMLPADTGLRLHLAGALDDRVEAGRGDRGADRRALVEQLEGMLAQASDGDPDRPELLGMATLAYARLSDGDPGLAEREPAVVDRMTVLARQAWQALGPDWGDWPLVGLMLAAGLEEQLRRPGAPRPDPATLDLAVDVLTEVERRVAGDFGQHLMTQSLLGLFLAARAQLTGSAGDISRAGPILLHAAQALPAGDPGWDGVAGNIAVAMSIAAHMGFEARYFAPAIGLLRDSAARSSGDADRDASVREMLGILLIEQSFSARSPDAREGIGHLRAAYEIAPPGTATRLRIALNLGCIQAGQFCETGDRQQLQAAEFYLAAARRLRAAGTAAPLLAEILELDSVLAVTEAQVAMAHALDGDHAAADVAVRNLRAAAELLPPGHPQAVRLGSDLGLALVMRAAREDSPGRRDQLLQEAIGQLDAAGGRLPDGHLLAAMTRVRSAWARGVRALWRRDAPALSEVVGDLGVVHGELRPGSSLRARCAAALAFLCWELHKVTRLAADLADALRWFTAADGEFGEHPGHPQHAALLAGHARLLRSAWNGRPAIDAGLAALRARGRDVLLQSGTANALAAARAAAADSAEFAGWCLEDGDPALAVEVLELGRGLVLHAATAVTAMADLLAAAGHGDLAGEWRGYAASAGPAPWDNDSAGRSGAAGATSGGPGDDGAGDDGAGEDGAGEDGAGYLLGLLAGASADVPGDLRARALAALAGSALASLLTPPRLAVTGEALRGTGTDALVYLLPPAAGRRARALVVSAAGAARDVPLPLLDGDPAGLGEYLAAHDALLASPDPTTDDLARRRDTLAAACEWAWPAVVGPVLRAVAGGPRGGDCTPGTAVPRVVLVPGGRLSLVPWHAARYREEPGGPWRYALEGAAFSYAASARQLLEASRRPALPLHASPVIVAGPAAEDAATGGSAAGEEAAAIRDRFYPGACYLGPGCPDGAGTPQEVLAALPSAARPGASMLHLACHADVSGGRPGQSHLELAGGEVLTVEEILRRAAGRAPDAAGGLIDLVACRSDLTAASYDEALTLATACLAAGAGTVLATRWEVRVQQSAVLAYMVHHFLAGEGLPPRDALRAAQLWMADPNRAVPPRMPPALARRAATSALADPVHWAAFTHQGR
ncbi:MAG TPA: CHAT domain-containing protein [Trebonia sp.]|nr:CHAT domain-containing protein [Trebonia sp.]